MNSKKILFSLTSALLLRFSLSALAQDKFPEQPGEMVEVNGHFLHIHCSGEGGPTVVFESAIGNWSLDWERVQPEAAKITRACSYDRAGMGWSEVSDLEKISSKGIANELHQ